MIINLPPKYVDLLQLGIDLIDSYNSKEDPKAVAEACEKIFTDGCGNIDVLIMEPSYAALALYGKVVLKDEKKAIALFERSKIPGWDLFNPDNSRIELIQAIKAKDDKLARTIMMIAFCLSHLDAIRCHGKVIFRGNGKPVDQEQPVKELGEEGEPEDDQTESDN